MTDTAGTTTVRFQGKGEAPSGVVVLLVAHGAMLGDRGKQIDAAADGWVVKAMKAASFKGARKATLELLAVPGTASTGCCWSGVGDMAAPTPMHWTEIGGVIGAALAAKKAKAATLSGGVRGHGAGWRGRGGPRVWRATQALHVYKIPDRQDVGGSRPAPKPATAAENGNGGNGGRRAARRYNSRWK